MNRIGTKKICHECGGKLERVWDEYHCRRCGNKISAEQMRGAQVDFNYEQEQP